MAALWARSDTTTSLGAAGLVGVSPRFFETAA